MNNGKSGTVATSPGYAGGHKACLHSQENASDVDFFGVEEGGIKETWKGNLSNDLN